MSWILGIIGLALSPVAWIGGNLLKLVGITNEPRLEVYSPFDRADPDEMVWWHVKVRAIRRRWLGQIQEVKNCLVELAFVSIDTGARSQIAGAWATDVPPYYAPEADFRVGDPPKNLPLVLRSMEEYHPPVQPSAKVDPDVTYLTGLAFLAHGSSQHQLANGQYEVEIRLYSGEHTWKLDKRRLTIPDKGLYGFVVAESLTNHTNKKYHEIRQSRTSRDEGILLRLSELRSSGVRLRNDGLSLQDPALINQWIEESRAWHETVKTEIAKISVSEAEIFGTLDLIEAPPFSEVSDAQLRFHVRIMSHRLRNLREFILSQTRT